MNVYVLGVMVAFTRCFLSILNRSKKRGVWCSMLSMVQIAKFESQRIIVFPCCFRHRETKIQLD